MARDRTNRSRLNTCENVQIANQNSDRPDSLERTRIVGIMKEDSRSLIGALKNLPPIRIFV
jgi:hypothetical protein